VTVPGKNRPKALDNRHHDAERRRGDWDARSRDYNSAIIPFPDSQLNDLVGESWKQKIAPRDCSFIVLVV
jgi:hypothetical protein